MSEKTIGRSDLHTHSTASDGLLSPGDLVELASSLGLEVLALTDHDTVAGVDEAWSVAKRRGITFIPGVELGTDYSQGECHVLGYFLDHRSPTLGETLQELQESRRQRGHRMVKRLLDLGLPLSWERIQELAQGGTITRSHVADALLEARHVASRQEAFDQYIGHDRPAYVPRVKLSPEDAIRLIQQARGVPVLAHPTFVEPGRNWSADLAELIPWPFLERLLAVGLRGLEAGYGEYLPNRVARLTELAEHYNLIVTGGSDFHGHEGYPALGSAMVPPEAVSDLLRLAQEAGSPWVRELMETVRP